MKALFLGSKQLGLSVLNCLRNADSRVTWTVVHPNDSNDPRSILRDFNDYAREHDLDLLIANSRAAAEAMILDAEPDIAFVCGWYWLISDALLARIPLGVFGIHNSLLPKYRGGAPLVWSIINGDAEVGASVFRFSSGIDDGDIALQVRVTNAPHETIATILPKLEAELLKELPGKWSRLLNGSAVLTKQDECSATFCGQRQPDHGLIEWSQSARRVHDFVRAQTPPYPGAFSLLAGRKITLLRTEPDERVFFGTPGQVLLRSGKTLLVSCGNATALRICEISVDNRTCPPTEIVHSVHERFDSRPRRE